MQNVPPNVVAVPPQADKDGGRNGSPNQLQPIVSVTVRGAHTSASAIFDEKIDVNDLGDHEHHSGQETDNRRGLISSTGTGLALGCLGKKKARNVVFSNSPEQKFCNIVSLLEFYHQPISPGTTG